MSVACHKHHEGKEDKKERGRPAQRAEEDEAAKVGGRFVTSRGGCRVLRGRQLRQTTNSVLNSLDTRTEEGGGGVACGRSHRDCTRQPKLLEPSQYLRREYRSLEKLM